MCAVDFGIEAIEKILPHRPPFLFVDRVIELDPNKRILALRAMREEEAHFGGHFPGRPIMPGVLIAEALAQTAGLLHGFSRLAEPAAENRIFYLAKADLKWTAPCYPKETLMLSAKLVREMGGLMAFSVRAFNDRADIAVGSLTLAAPQEER